jgi:hypothetical protein
MAVAPFQFAKRDAGSGVAPVEEIRVNDTQTLVPGYLLIMSTKKASKSGAAPAADTVLGVAVNSVTTTTATDADKIRYIPVQPDMVWRVQYLTSGTKTSFTDADLHTTYDINATSHKLDPDDTTGGFLELVGYNNTDNVAFVRISAAKLYFA